MSNQPLTLDPKRARRLREFAEKVHRPSDRLLKEAVDCYLEVQKWQLNDINNGLAEADAGDFASTDEMSAMLDGFKTEKE